MAFISVFPGFTAESGFDLIGDIGDGNSITITGSGFGTKPNGAKPRFFIEFGKGDDDLDANSRGAWTKDWHANASIQQDQVAPNRTDSFRYTFAQDGGDGQGAVNGTYFDMNLAPDTYVFMRYRINVDGTELFAANEVWNIKDLRMWATESGFDHNWSGWRKGQSNTTHGNPRHKIESMTGSDFTPDADVWGFRKDNWVTNEWEIHQGGVDVVDSTWTLFRNAISDVFVDSGSSPFTSRTVPDNQTYAFRLFFPQEQKVSDPGFQVYWWFDLFYADDSLFRVIISDEPTWDSATTSQFYVREPQIPTAVADDEVTFTMRQGTHATFANKYLYIIDSAATAQKILKFN